MFTGCSVTWMPSAPPLALHLVDFRCSPTTPSQICTTTMCRYDFCLFGTCGHTVAGAVVEYCEKAVAPAATFSGGLSKYFPGYHHLFFPFSLLSSSRMQLSSARQHFTNILPERTASLQDFHGTAMPSLPLFPTGGFHQLLAGPSTQVSKTGTHTPTERRLTIFEDRSIHCADPRAHPPPRRGHPRHRREQQPPQVSESRTSTACE